MPRILSLPLLLLVVLAGYAQEATVTNIIPGASKDTHLRFPVVSLPDKAIARKINDYLQTNVLKQTTLKAPGMQVFDKIKWTEKQAGIDELYYTVLRSNPKFLSLKLASEWMAAYPTDNLDFFLFNIQNGEIILVGDIINPTGIKALEEDIKRKRNALIAANLKTLQTRKDEDIDMESIKDNYQTCNREADPDHFYISGENIVFHRTPCLPHVIQSLDINLDISYPITGIRTWLTPFGQKLFDSNVKDIGKDSLPSLSKPLRGKMDNKYDIVMQLHFNNDHSVDGFYYYNNYQSAIELSGTFEKGVLKLTEHDNAYNDTAVFEATVSGTTISGNWTNLKTKKTLGFVVKN